MAVKTKTKAKAKAEAPRSKGGLINKKKLEVATNILKSMTHPMRLAIIELLEKKKRLNVTDIYETLSLEQAVASHHLGILRDQGVLGSERDGKKIFYTLDRARIAQIQDVIEKFVN